MFVVKILYENEIGMFDILGIIMNPNLVPQIHNLFKIEQKVMDFLPLYYLEILCCISSRIDSPSPLGRKGGSKYFIHLVTENLPWMFPLGVVG